MGKSIAVKRQIIVKTIVTEDFKQNATTELHKESQLIDNQINHLQMQINQVIQQAQQNTNVALAQHEAEQIITELNNKLQQLFAVKQNLSYQLENITKTKTSEQIITGSLESYVDLEVGNNIYDKLLDKEIIVKDGIIQEIKN